MATTIKNPGTVTVGTSEVEYDFSADLVPTDVWLKAVIETSSSNAGTIQFSNEAITADHAVISANGYTEVLFKNKSVNLRAKASIAGQVFRVFVSFA